MAQRKKKPTVDVEVINMLLRRAETLFGAAGDLLSAQKAELERVAGEAREMQDSQKVVESRENTLLKKLEAEREEFDARVQRAQLEKKRISQQVQQMNRDQQANRDHQGHHHQPNRPQKQKSEIQRRIEQRREPLKGNIKGLENIDRESLPAAPTEQGEAASPS